LPLYALLTAQRARALLEDRPQVSDYGVPTIGEVVPRDLNHDPSQRLQSIQPIHVAQPSISSEEVPLNRLGFDSNLELRITEVGTGHKGSIVEDLELPNWNRQALLR
jgi:hypothetical protein